MQMDQKQIEKLRETVKVAREHNFVPSIDGQTLLDLLTLAEQALSPIGDGEVAEFDVREALGRLFEARSKADYSNKHDDIMAFAAITDQIVAAFGRARSQLHQARSELEAAQQERERTADARSRADFAYDNAIKSARADHKAHARRLFRRSGSRNRAAGTRHAAS